MDVHPLNNLTRRKFDMALDVAAVLADIQLGWSDCPR
jgi:hypothetical protein